MACLVNLKGGISISYLLFVGINYYVYELNLSNEPLVANWDIYSIKSGGKLGSRSTMSKAQAKSSFIFFLRILKLSLLIREIRFFFNTVI